MISLKSVWYACFGYNLQTVQMETIRENEIRRVLGDSYDELLTLVDGELYVSPHNVPCVLYHCSTELEWLDAKDIGGILNRLMMEYPQITQDMIHVVDEVLSELPELRISSYPEMFRSTDTSRMIQLSDWHEYSLSSPLTPPFNTLSLHGSDDPNYMTTQRSDDSNYMTTQCSNASVSSSSSEGSLSDHCLSNAPTPTPAFDSNISASASASASALSSSSSSEDSLSAPVYPHDIFSSEVHTPTSGATGYTCPTGPVGLTEPAGRTGSADHTGPARRTGSTGVTCDTKDTNSYKDALPIIRLMDSTVIGFGKHKGKSITYVVQTDSGYVKWMLKNTYTPITAEQLTNPTDKHGSFVHVLTVIRHARDIGLIRMDDSNQARRFRTKETRYHKTDVLNICTKEKEARRDKTDVFNISCKICMNSTCSDVMLPCGHVCCCSQCIIKITTKNNRCPLCRKKISSTVPIYV